MLQDSIFEARKRLEIYEFLSYAFLNLPSKELLNLIKEGSEYLKRLTDENLDFFKDKTLEDFTQEYYDRFFVPTSGYFVPPYESVIKNKKEGKGKKSYGRVDGEETFHVKSCYELVNFKIDELNAFQPLKDNHYPDHIAFELAFITYLINFELQTLEDGFNDRANKWRKLQKDFLRDHISTWIGKYASLSEENGRGLYSYLSNIATAWIDVDLEYLIKEFE